MTSPALPLPSRVVRLTALAALTAAAVALLASRAASQGVSATQPAQPAAPGQLDSTTLSAFRWRSIGPANMAGRITDIEGIPSPSRTFYVAAAAGGIWKTTNAGTSFQPVFDRERVISMGDLAIAPSDTNVVYAGTGEEDSRNSISPGGGVYKTTDGGKTWKLMGLEATQAIGRIVVHPTNPNIAYVAALGHPWGPNRERGLYKTSDGGATWQMSKFISDRAGFVDVAMDPSDPNTLYASSWERVRGPYFLKSGGPGSALWKTTDAGTTWTEIRGGGFPTTMKGRIGIAVAQSNPKVVYALVEADTAPNPVKKASAAGRQVRPSGLYRSNDAGATWTKMNDRDVRPFYYSQVRADTKNPDRVYWSSTPVNFSDDGGKTVRNGTIGIHVDHHAMWIDPNDARHFIVGNDGGVSQTWDGGGNYDFLNTMALGQFYAVSYDMGYPYRVCGGLQDNGSWCGPSRRRNGPITNAMWFTVGGGDGFVTAQDPTNPDIIYSESQGGAMGRLNYATGERVQLGKPSWRTRYQQFEDSIIIARGDTTRPATPALTRRLAELRTRELADSATTDMRFNWNTPFFLSPHSPSTFYAAGNRVLKSTSRGDRLYPISPDLSTKDSAKIRVSMRTTGGITRDATGAETYGTVTALAESPIRPGLLYAGTDDGNVWLTRNDGATWENLTGRFPGVPRLTYVSRIEPSSFDSATFYVTFDNHRVNDFTPYVYATNNYGKTFRSIASNLPTGGPDFVYVIREDPNNRDLLFVGTDVGVYVSRNRGASWQKFMSGLPTVPVQDLRIQPRERELIAGTHGRSIWITDIAPLEQMADSVMGRSAYLFVPRTAYQYGQPPVNGEAVGQKAFRAESAPYGAAVSYRLASGNPRERARLLITNAAGDTMQTLTGPGGAGIHTVYWDFRAKAPRATRSPSQLRDSVRFVRRMDVVLDSLAKSGVDTAELTRIRTRITSGGGGFGGGFGGSGGGNANLGSFAERPAESPLPRTGGRGAAGARGAAARGGERAGAEGAAPDPELFRTVSELLRPEGSGFGAGPFGGGTMTTVPTGDYIVSLTAGGQTMKRTLRVERISGGAADESHDDEGEDDQ